jgi:ABC-type glycerol-3-phosphate transport system permease component
VNNKHTKSGRLLATLILWIACFVTLLPLVWLVISSFKTNESFLTSLLVPKSPIVAEGVDPSTIPPEDLRWKYDLTLLTLKHYRELFGQLDFVTPLLNSVLLSSATAALGTLFAAMGGYALARFEFAGRKLVTALVIGAVLIPAPLLLAPGYELLFKIGLLNTFTGVILPAAAPAFGVFLFRQSIMSSVPRELLEAARLDGCGEVRMFFAVVMPLVKPMIGTFVMLTFLGAWNNFVTPQVILQSESKFPLSVAVAQLRGTYYQNYGLQMAGTVVSIVPVLVLFLALQRSFVSGLTAGAVKS